MTARCTDGKAHVFDVQGLAVRLLRCRYGGERVAVQELFARIESLVQERPESLERDCGD